MLTYLKTLFAGEFQPKRSVAVTAAHTIVPVLAASLLLQSSAPARTLSAKAPPAQSLTSTGSSQVTKSAQKNPYRLPGYTIPSAYDLRLNPDLEKFTFAGNVDIRIHQNVESKSIILNSLNLKIAKASITRANETSNLLHAIAVTLDQSHEQATLKFANNIKPGNYVLHLEFSGLLGTSLEGFYRSSYKDKDGKEHWLFSTDLEPTNARRVFPCFDEPDLKAPIALSVQIPKDYVAISNSPAAKEQAAEQPDQKLVTFEATPKIPTYIFALVIGKLESEPALNYEGIPVRVYAIPGMAKQGHYAQAMAVKLLAYYHKYFGIQYPGKKLDLIAIPNFSHGAMENLGAVTFRSSNLLLDEKASDLSTRQRVAEVVAHEIAHMWFGDLVTMQWWDDIWLNESFATWMATKAIGDIEPSWDVWNDFGLTRAKAEFSDSLVSTRPVHTKVQSPVEAMALFDEIAYDKGASLMQMLESYLGADTFREGMRHYMKAHAYGNATRDDLWKSLSVASGADVKNLMHNWIEAPGYPLVTISNNGNKIKLEQKRFLLQGNKPSNTIWQIPICYRDIDKKQSRTLLLNTPAKQFNIADKDTTIFNSNTNGYFRVNYTKAQIKQLLPVLKTKLSAAERLSLLSDRSNLALAGTISAPDYLNCLKAYRGENDPSIAWIMIENLRILERMVEPANKSSFQKFVRYLLLPIKESYEWAAKPSELPNISLLRTEVLRALGTFGQDATTIKEASQYFDKYMQNPTSVDPEILEAITTIVAYNGDAKIYTKIREQYKTAKTPFDEERNMRALCVFQKKQLLEQTLAMCEKKEFRSQDAPSVMAALVRNQVSADFTWNYVNTHWAKLHTHYPVHALGRIIGNLSYDFRPQRAQAVINFLQSHDLGENTRRGKKTIELLSIYQTFAKRNGAEINTWLQGNYSK